MSLLSIGTSLLQGVGSGFLSKMSGWGQTFDQRRAADDARAMALGNYTPTELAAMGLDPGTPNMKRPGGTAVNPTMPVPALPVAPLPQLPGSVPGLVNIGFEPAMATVPKLAQLGGQLALRALPGAGAAVSSAVKGVTSLARKYPMAAGAVGGFLVDAAGNFLADSAGRLVPARKRGRRINPLNHRALKRALRRVKAARHICAAIERELPKRRAPHRSSKRCR